MIICHECNWIPPPGAMDENGTREPDGTWTLNCQRCHHPIVSGIAYQATFGRSDGMTIEHDPDPRA